MKWVSLIVAAVIALGLWLWLGDIASDRNYRLEVLTPITLLKEPPQSYPQQNTEVGNILPGEAVEVLRMGYGKDFRAWKVKGATNQEGWFIEERENVRVSNKST